MNNKLTGKNSNVTTIHGGSLELEMYIELERVVDDKLPNLKERLKKIKSKFLFKDGLYCVGGIDLDESSDQC